MAATVLATRRLTVRSWRDEDVEPLAAIGTDLEVVRYLRGVPWSIEDAAQIVAQNRDVEASTGVTMWALEDRGSGTLVGYCGFAPTNAACLRPDLIEIGWALDRHRWGEGLATEAAVGVMPVGLDLFGPGRIVAKCHIDNSASERVMRRVGLRRVGVFRAFDDSTIVCRFPASYRSPAE